MPAIGDDAEYEGLRVFGDIAALYDAIAEGRTRDALDLIYEKSGYASHLLAPATQLRAVELRRSAS